MLLITSLPYETRIADILTCAAPEGSGGLGVGLDRERARRGRDGLEGEGKTADGSRGLGEGSRWEGRDKGGIRNATRDIVGSR